MLLLLGIFPIIDLIASLWLILTHGWLLLVLVATSILGIVMLRHHRLVIIQLLMSRVQQGHLTTLLWIARYYVAAILFAFPGLLTDILAALCLIPWQGRIARPLSPDEVIEAEFTRESSAQHLQHDNAASVNRPDEN